MIDRDPGVVAAIEAAGSINILARRLCIGQAAVSRWRRVPAERVIQIERDLGVAREVLRPDLHPVRAGCGHGD